MNIKDIKVGDGVRFRDDVFSPELIEIYTKHGLTRGNIEKLQNNTILTVRGIQAAETYDGGDWDSITLSGSGFFWPVELFKLVGNSNKTNEETVQEDIRRIGEIIQRYNLSDISGPAVSLINWLKENGREELEKEQMAKKKA